MKKADDILLSDTYYITPNGLDAEDNYSFHHTTAYDLAKPWHIVLIIRIFYI